MTDIPESRTKVFVVDDHELVRNAIALLVDSTPDLELVGEAGTKADALSGIRATEPNVAIVDVQLPDGNGTHICLQLQRSNPNVRCIMLTAYDTDVARDAAILAGAAGFLIKDIRGSGLIEAIREVASGHYLIDSGARHRAFEGAG